MLFHKLIISSKIFTAYDPPPTSLIQVSERYKETVKEMDLKADICTAWRFKRKYINLLEIETVV